MSKDNHAFGETDEKEKRPNPSGPNGILHIKVRSNNVNVTITDDLGGVISWSTSGRAGFKGARKSSPLAAQVAGANAAKEAMDAGIRRVRVKAKGAEDRSKDVIRAVREAGMEITSVETIE